MDKNIKNSLNDLLKVIRKNAVYEAFKKAEKQWSESKDSQNLLNNFLETRSTLQVFQQGNFPGVEEQKKKVKELYEKVSNDSNIQEWMEAQEKYQQFIWDQAEYLTRELGIKFSPKPKGCCG
jgi:cell fate (sporulation/competence/biofilm development) regulator YlbF (YheA/YmcA/DUF963 family)